MDVYEIWAVRSDALPGDPVAAHGRRIVSPRLFTGHIRPMSYGRYNRRRLRALRGRVPGLFMRAYVIALACAGLTACNAPSSAPRSDAPEPNLRTTDVPLAVERRVVESRVASGATLASLLRGSRVAEREIAAVVARAAAVFDLRKVRSAQPFRLEQADDGMIRRFEYEIDR